MALSMFPPSRLSGAVDVLWKTSVRKSATTLVEMSRDET